MDDKASKTDHKILGSSNDGTPSTILRTDDDESAPKLIDSTTMDTSEPGAVNDPDVVDSTSASSATADTSPAAVTAAAQQKSSPKIDDDASAKSIAPPADGNEHKNDDDDEDDVEDDDDEEPEEDEEDEDDENDENEVTLLSQEAGVSYYDSCSSAATNVDSSALSVMSGDDDASDVCSSIADSETADSIPTSSVTTAVRPSPKASSKSRKRSRQPPIMIGYRKRRKAQPAAASKKYEDERGANSTTSSPSAKGAAAAGAEMMELRASHSDGDDKSEESSSRKSLEQSSSEENLFESSSASGGARTTRKYSSVANEITNADKFCWICHKEGGNTLKCIACPRVYHCKCHFQAGVPDMSTYDSSNFHCPECSAILKADNVNTRSPVLVTVNLEQLCTLLKHVIGILKSQKDSHYFWGPVDTKEFPHYRHYVVYPMDISLLEKNIKNKVYGCTEAFLADVKWIVHNSIVFNSRAAKITNVAKNLLKICKREILEIETCAECYYNSLVRKDTWFIEVCKKPHLLVWARLKGYPPWPAKALKYKDGMVDCRFFGAHDKAWVPLKDCFLYSKITPQPVKVKKGSHLESGIQELEKHIKKLRDKFGIFVYPAARIPYRPSQELEQLRTMLPNYNPNNSIRSTKYLIHPDRVRNNLQPKTLFGDVEGKSAIKDEDEAMVENEEKLGTEEADSDANIGAEEMEKTSDSPPHTSHNDSNLEDSSFESSSEAETSIAPADQTPPRSTPAAKSTSPVVASINAAVTTAAVAAETSSPSSTPPKVILETASTPPRKLVSVKNIESINASVSSTPNSSPASVKSPERTAAKTLPSDESKEGSPLVATSVSTAAVTAILTTAAATPTVATASPKTATVSSKSPSVKVNPTVTMTTKAPDSAPSSVGGGAPTTSSKEESDFDLNKVKDEPLEGSEMLTPDIDAAVEKTLTPSPVAANRLEAAVVSSSSASSKPQSPSPLPPSSLVSIKMKRPADQVIEDVHQAKKGRGIADTKCRTVNITENVTLSLVNQTTPSSSSTPPVEPPKPLRPPVGAAVLRKPQKPVSSSSVVTVSASAVVSTTSLMPPVTSRLVYGVSSPNEINVMRPKAAGLPPAGSQVIAINRPNTKVQPRVVNHPSQTNGVMGISTKPAVTVTPSRASPKTIDSYSELISRALDECMSECRSQFRRIFESTLDKLAGKGDLRARIVSLKKETESMKRSHELTMDEMRRDYEVQIAELRATSVAKTQFDLAAERLKFEQEKERAVKEAKSKQWCSNCQKIANYYCCWNTAYCDFECQKEHWIQHMHVCKNDVKKKTPESSENEPPRILMQSEISNGYPMNGYDKTGSTYSYGNVGTPVVSSHSLSRNNFHRPHAKLSTVARAPRPLLPRVTVSSSPSSNSSPSNGAVAPNAYQNLRPTYSMANNGPAVYTSMYQK